MPGLSVRGHIDVALSHRLSMSERHYSRRVFTLPLRRAACQAVCKCVLAPSTVYFSSIGEACVISHSARRPNASVSFAPNQEMTNKPLSFGVDSFLRCVHFRLPFRYTFPTPAASLRHSSSGWHPIACYARPACGAPASCEALCVESFRSLGISTITNVSVSSCSFSFTYQVYVSYFSHTSATPIRLAMSIISARASALVRRLGVTHFQPPRTLTATPTHALYVAL
jgi:hypothetical protein